MFSFFPDTPHYHVRKGNRQRAIDSLEYFRGKSAAVSAEFEEIQASVDMSMSNHASLFELFRGKANLLGKYFLEASFKSTQSFPCFSRDDCCRFDLLSKFLGHRRRAVLQRDNLQEGRQFIGLCCRYDNHRRCNAYLVVHLTVLCRQKMFRAESVAASFGSWHGSQSDNDGVLLLPRCSRHSDWIRLAAGDVFGELHSLLLRWLRATPLHCARRDVCAGNQISCELVRSQRLLGRRFWSDQSISAAWKRRREPWQLLDLWSILHNRFRIYMDGGVRDKRIDFGWDSRSIEWTNIDTQSIDPRHFMLRSTLHKSIRGLLKGNNWSQATVSFIIFWCCKL